MSGWPGIIEAGYCSRFRRCTAIRAGREPKPKDRRAPETPVPAKTDQIVVDGEKLRRKIALPRATTNAARRDDPLSEEKGRGGTVYVTVTGTPYLEQTRREAGPGSLQSGRLDHG